MSEAVMLNGISVFSLTQLGQAFCQHRIYPIEGRCQERLFPFCEHKFVTVSIDPCENGIAALFQQFRVMLTFDGKKLTQSISRF